MSEFGPDRNHRRQQAFALDGVLIVLVIGMEAENHVAILHPHCGVFTNRVESRDFGAQLLIRKSQFQDVCTPIGNVKERVEVLVHAYVNIARVE